MQLDEIQDFLAQNDLDGWLIYDFHGQNRIAATLFKMRGDNLLTRRWFYFIPQTGAPSLLIHKIERHNFPEPPDKVYFYVSWEALQENLGSLLGTARNIAMEYSPQCAIPYVSCVDAGTVEMVRQLGVNIRSSANLIQYFQSRWRADQLASHRRAAHAVDKIKDMAFDLIATRIQTGGTISEMEVAEFILKNFAECRMTTVDPPIVAVNANASNPHYVPTPDHHRAINRDDLVLIDLFSKENTPDAIYADITWMGFVADSVPKRQAQVFKVVTDARDAGLQMLRDAAESGSHIAGCAVDKCVREHICANGYGEYFDHRTGHSLDTSLHGSGVNIDSLETRDDRLIVPGMGFTIEPGIYLPEFGVRSEINVYYSETGPQVYGPIQREIIPLLR